MFNEHNSFQFDQFRSTVGVNNENISLNNYCKNNLMPVVVNNEIYLNSCGDSNLSNVILQNLCQDNNALDTVSRVNMISCDFDDSGMDLYKSYDINTHSALQHGFPPGSITVHIEFNHQTFPSNDYVRACAVLFHQIDRFIHSFFDYSDNSGNQLVNTHSYL